VKIFVLMLLLVSAGISSEIVAYDSLGMVVVIKE